jgi:hypothetical protein
MKRHIFLPIIVCLVIICCTSNRNIPSKEETTIEKIIDSYELVLDDEKKAEIIFQNLLLELNEERYIFFNETLDLSTANLETYDYTYKLTNVHISREGIISPAPPILELSFINESGETRTKSWQLFTDEAYDKNINKSYLYISSKNAQELFYSRTGIKGYNIRQNSLPSGAYLLKTFIPSYLEYIGLLSGELIVQQDVSKIIRNCLEVGNTFTPFNSYEIFSIPKSLFEVIQGRKINDARFLYLVILNDTSYSYFKPFYIEANKQLKTMYIQGKELIFEEIDVRYIRNENYYDNGMPKSTFLFQLSSMPKVNIVNDFQIENGTLVMYRGNGGTIDIPITVSRIEEIAFMGAKNPIEIINIPLSVKKIEVISLNDHNELMEINVSKLNPYLTSINGILFSKNMTEIIRFPPSRDGTGYDIPLGIELISDRAFFRCKKLVSLVLPDSVKKIEPLAFADCEKLKNINIPNGIAEIGFSVFSGCRSLENINIPNSVIKIENYAFSGCEEITQIDIPPTVESIGEMAFYDCKNLKIVKISKKTKLSNYVFPEGIKIEYID